MNGLFLLEESVNRHSEVINIVASLIDFPLVRVLYRWLAMLIRDFFESLSALLFFIILAVNLLFFCLKSTVKQDDVFVIQRQLQLRDYFGGGPSHSKSNNRRCFFCCFLANPTTYFHLKAS